MTPEQKEWAESKVGRTMRGNKPHRFGVVLDYKEDLYQLGVFFVLEMAAFVYEESYRMYPNKIQRKGAVIGRGKSGR